MDFLVIIPAHNEEKYIRYTLDSILNQTHKPKKVIVVNDRSTDKTEEIIKEYSAKIDWIYLINKKSKQIIGNNEEIPDCATTISSLTAIYSPDDRMKPTRTQNHIRAFYTGLVKEDLKDFDVIVKLDGDLTLPEDYFLKIDKIFKDSPAVGIAGGICVVKKNGEWKPEAISNTDHIRGPIKSYRKECFQSINGLKEGMGWDAIDEYIARMEGWTVYVDQGSLVKHHRKTNRASNWFEINMRNGASFYRMRYGLILGVTSCLKRAVVHKPKIISGLVALLGFLFSAVKRVPFLVSNEEGKYIRKYRFNFIMDRFK